MSFCTEKFTYRWNGSRRQQDRRIIDAVTCGVRRGLEDRPIPRRVPALP